MANSHETTRAANSLKLSADKIVMLPVSEVRPYDKNPRKNADAVKFVKASIEQFGFKVPIIIDSNRVIVCGHTRLLAAKSLGMSEVPCIMADDLTDDQIRAFRLADNKVGEFAEWDMDLLGDELDAIADACDIDMGDFGFDLDSDEEETEVVEDEVPEEVEPVCKKGEVWQLGEHRLMCGDSTSADDVAKLMNGEKADLCFTDPPYGVSYTGGIQFKSDGSVEQNNRQMIANDDIDIYAKVLEVLKDVVNGPCYIWFADKNAASLYTAAEKYGEIHAQIIWVKNGGYGALNANYKQKHEPCLYWNPKGATLNFIGATTETTIWEINKDGKNEYHPTQKPVALSGKAISNHKGDIILDLFGGSGSTMMACEQLGRKCRMMELDPHYCDVIIARWEKLTGQKAVKLEG